VRSSRVDPFLGLVEAIAPLWKDLEWNVIESVVYGKLKSLELHLLSFYPKKKIPVGSRSFDLSSHVSHLIMHIQTNTDCTCTEVLQMHSSLREDEIQ
jgi:hypothetical protein